MLFRIGVIERRRLGALSYKVLLLKVLELETHHDSMNLITIYSQSNGIYKCRAIICNPCQMLVIYT